MSYAACDQCHRVFITGSDAPTTVGCPNCRRALRPVTGEEARSFLRALPPPDVEPAQPNARHAVE